MKDHIINWPEAFVWAVLALSFALIWVGMWHGWPEINIHKHYDKTTKKKP